MTIRFATLLTLAALFGASDAQAQSCSDHAVFQKGTVVSLAHFNHKGKKLGEQRSVTESVAPIADGVRADIRASSTLKGAPKDDLTFEFTCTGETVSLDMRSLVPTDQMKAYEDWEINVDSSDLAYPSALSVGQSLPDGKITMRLTMPNAEAAPAGLSNVTFEVAVTNRRVEAQESITTAAGTFEAFKIVYDTDLQVRTLINIRQQTSHVEWYAPSLGTTVKSENYQKGKLRGSTELIGFERG